MARPLTQPARRTSWLVSLFTTLRALRWHLRWHGHRKLSRPHRPSRRQTGYALGGRCWQGKRYLLN